MSTAKVCLQCGTEYDGSTLFCPRDGSALKLVDPGSSMIGQVVAERFLIHKELGKGGMGQVFLAEQVRIGRRCALKVIREGLVSDPDAVLRFNREASNAASISHPNVVQVYDFGESREGLIFLAMEYVDGESLGALLAREGTVAPLRAVSIAAQVARALTAAHDLKIIHRDLKPDNVMLGRDRDGSDLVKVVDFGVARVMDAADQKVTGTGLVIGTPEYMSPEQFTGKPLDGRSDLYSLALILFRMLAGTPAFDAEGAREVLEARFSRQPKRLAEANPSIAWPPGLQEVIDRGMALKVEDRYQTVEAFADALVAITSYWNPGAEEFGSAGLRATPGAFRGASGASAAARRIDPPGASGAPEPGVADRPAPVAIGGATAAFSSGAPPMPPASRSAASATSDDHLAAATQRGTEGPATGAIDRPSAEEPGGGARRGPILWAAGLAAVLAISLFATRGMWGGRGDEQTSAVTPSQAATQAGGSQAGRPATGDTVASARPDSTSAGDARQADPADGGRSIAAGGNAPNGTRSASGARDTTSGGSAGTPPANAGAGEESAESAAVRGQLARLKTLTDSAASPAQAREALRLAAGIHPDTREGRVELKYRTLEANIILDQTAAVCSLLSQLRFEAKGTRFEEAVSAYGAVAQQSCPGRDPD